MSNATELAREDAKSDMTPMIDVVFLMIIFFVCIDFKVLEAKLPAFLPKDMGSAPQRAEPQEQLPVRIHVAAAGTVVPPGHTGIAPTAGRAARHSIVGHRVEWEIGPRRLSNLQDAVTELRRVAANPASQVPDAESGGRKLMACVV